MTENSTASSDNFSLNLAESSTFTRTVPCKLPGKAPNSWRHIKFDATYKVLDEKAFDELMDGGTTVREALRELLVSVSGIDGGTTADGKQLSALDAVIALHWTADAAFAAYHTYLGENSRDITTSAAERKNSRRSRAR